MAFAIKIHSTNGSTAYCYTLTKRWEASPDMRTNWDWVHLPYKHTRHDTTGGERAQFATREEAETVALACRWNNQRYSIHVVRGEVNSALTPEERETIVSCSAP